MTSMDKQHVSPDNHNDDSSQNDDVAPMNAQLDNNCTLKIYEDALLLNRLLALITVV